MLVVTGGAGFVGSNIVAALNRDGVSDILVVDHLGTGDKFLNLRSAAIADYAERDEFFAALEHGKLDGVTGILHQGACTDTMATDGAYVMRVNYQFSKALLHFALARGIPFVYASSASVYGNRGSCTEDAANEEPLNLYAFSKVLFDRYVRRVAAAATSTVVGLRYYNVYGAGEAHKGRMASMVWQLARQLAATGEMRLFEGSGGYGDGEQRRDFIWVGDVAAINLHFLRAPARVGIYNVGTAKSRSFNDIARTLAAQNGGGTVTYLPFPAALAGKYQNFTEADLTALRTAGYKREMATLEAGIAQAWPLIVEPSSASTTNQSLRGHRA
jgi:ADP-L-glycero-D-manno-heptose 6-epimerase